MHLAHVQQWLLQRGVSILDVAVLCARSGPGMICSRMDYVGFEAPNHVLAGYGLQLRSGLADRRQIVTVQTLGADRIIAQLIRS